MRGIRGKLQKEMGCAGFIRGVPELILSRQCGFGMPKPNLRSIVFYMIGAYAWHTLRMVPGCGPRENMFFCVISYCSRIQARIVSSAANAVPDPAAHGADRFCVPDSGVVLEFWQRVFGWLPVFLSRFFPGSRGRVFSQRRVYATLLQEDCTAAVRYFTELGGGGAERCRIFFRANDEL